MKVRVVCYEGYRAEETPRAFLLGDLRVEVVRVLDRWRGEDHEYVKLDGSDGARYILRYDRSRDEWEIHMSEYCVNCEEGARRDIIIIEGASGA